MRHPALAPSGLALLAALLPAGVHASPVDEVLDNARHWQARNQPELMRQAVFKALSVDPGNAEALLMQAQFDLKAGNRSLAEKRLALLQRLHPFSPSLRQLEALLRLEQGEGRLFSAAQSMARSARVEEAVAIARRVFPEGPPGGDLSLQYYQILSASPRHWQEATAGLQKLVAESPRDSRYQLALALHLTQREATRDRGVQELTRLARQGESDLPALRSGWRDALLGLAPRRASLARIDDYLGRNPDDAEVRRWRAELGRRTALAAEIERQRHDPAVIRRDQLLAALSAGREDAGTERELLALAEARPQDADLQGGIGRLLMRQGRHDEAVAYFRRAAAMDAAGRAKWLDLGRTATFWGLMRQVRVAREAGRPDDAWHAIQQALALKPAQPDALALRADLEKDRLLPDGGVGKYRAIADRARAAEMRHEADDLVAAGQRDDAIARLRQAVALDAGNPWLRYDLARLLQQTGQATEADTVMAPLLAAGGDDLAGSRYAYALLAGSQDRTDAALAALGDIPEGQRSEGMIALQQRLLLDRALAALKPVPGVTGTARAQALAEAERLSAGDPGLTLRVASALVRADEPAQGRALMASRVAEAERAGAADLADWHLRQAALYDQLADEAALTAALERLEARPQDLTDAQHAEMRALRVNAAARAIAALRTRRAYPDARLLVARSLAQWPDEPALLQQQAGVELDDFQTDQAALQYRALLKRRPDWPEAVQGLADALVAGGHEDEARAELDALASRQPASVDVLLLRGRLAERLGEYADARRWYERALAAEGRPLPDPVPVEPAFAGSSAERALFRLEQRRDGYVETGLIYRTKSGQDGLSTTRVTEIPTEFRIPAGYDGHVIGHVDQVEINAGNLPAAVAQQASFGQVLAKSPAGVPVSGQAASGVAVGLGYETDRLRVDLGSTPVGFLVTNWVGGVRYSDADANRYSSIELFRRPVTSSLLSYAGQRDPATGAVWGGVVRTGTSFRFSFSDEGVTRALFGRVALLQGSNVAGNNELRLGASQSHDLITARDMTLSAGVSTVYWHFQRDLSNFTYGQGGYYSPQQYLSLSLPARWTGRWHDWSWLLEPSVGVSWASSSASVFHPTDAGLQAQAEANAALNPGLPTPGSAGSSGTSFNYSLEGALEKRLAPNWFAGAGFRLDRSPYYTPNVFQLYLRYELKSKRGLVEFPPRMIKPYSEF